MFEKSLAFFFFFFWHAKRAFFKIFLFFGNITLFCFMCVYSLKILIFSDCMIWMSERKLLLELLTELLKLFGKIIGMVIFTLLSLAQSQIGD